MNHPPLQRRLSTEERARLQRLLLWAQREVTEREGPTRVADRIRRTTQGFASAELEGAEVSDFDQLAVLELVRRGVPEDAAAGLISRDATTPLPPTAA